MKVKIITLFPMVFPGVLGIGIVGRALKNSLWQLETVDLRQFSIKGRVDDSPYGGGAGMVISPVILGNCLDKIIENKPKIIYMSSKGKFLTSIRAKELAEEKEIIILCGRYEGIDERVIKYYDIEEICIGPYVLSGGEVAAMVLLESIVRNIKGAINDDSLFTESFSNNLKSNPLCTLEHPQYTRPAVWKRLRVPKVLREGHHEKIVEWKRKNSKKIKNKFG
jgi:tRNA (guanine37-N1)-methyltransferase